MALNDLQTALARLYTDDRFREAVSEGSLSALDLPPGLSEEDRAVLVGVATRDSRAADYAASLVAKRRGEVAKMLPATARILGSRMRILFRAHAKRAQFSGPRKHQADAVEFARWIVATGDCASGEKLAGFEIDVIRFESERLRVHTWPRLIAVRAFRFPVHRLVNDAPAEVKRRATLMVWMRLPLKSAPRLFVF